MHGMHGPGRHSIVNGKVFDAAVVKRVWGYTKMASYPDSGALTAWRALNGYRGLCATRFSVDGIDQADLMQGEALTIYVDSGPHNIQAWAVGEGKKCRKNPNTTRMDVVVESNGSDLIRIEDSADSGWLSIGLAPRQLAPQSAEVAYRR